MPDTIDALLFDLGRVLLDIDMNRAHRRWAELAGMPADRLDPGTMPAVMQHEIFHGHERGHVSDAAFFAHVNGALGLGLTEAQMLDGWNSIFIGEMAGIRDVLARVAGKRSLYVFSNTNAAHQVYWSRHFAGLLAPFDKVYASHELGHRKPDAEAFAAVVADMGIPAERVLFFDDAAGNIAGGRAFGLQAAHVSSSAEIMAVLDGAGL